MSWLTPWLAGGVAAFAVPALVVLYFLKLRRREVDVGSTLIWMKSVRDLRANAPFQRLRRNLLLFVQLVVLALVLLAIAQPVVEGERAPSDRYVLLLDRSASMSAVDGDGGRSRMARSLEEARSFVRGLGSVGGGAEVMVVSFAGGAAVVRPFSSDTGALLSAIDRVSVGDGPSRLSSAAEVVRPHVEPGAASESGVVAGAAELVLHSDGRIEDLSDVRFHPDTLVRFMSFGRVAGSGSGGVDGSGNVGITAIRAARPFDEPTRVDVFVGLSNSGADGVEVELELRLDGEAVEIRAVRVPGAEEGGALGSNGVVFTLDRSSGAVAEAEILGTDALAADDVAAVWIPPARRLRVGFVDESGDPFLDSLLDSLGFGELVRMTSGEFERRAEEGSLDSFDLFVLNGWVPEAAAFVGVGGAVGGASGDGRGGAGGALTLDDEPGLPGGLYLVFDAVPALSGLSRIGEASGGLGAGGVVTSARLEHPVLRYVSAEELRVRDQALFSAGGSARVLAETGSGPLIAEVAHRGVSALVFGFDPVDSSWFVDPNMVVLVASAVDYLSRGLDAEREAGSMRTGEVLSERLPEGAREVRLSGPGVEGLALELTPDNRVSFGPVERVGVYRVSWSGPAGPLDSVRGGRAERVVCVNLLSEVESDVRASERLSFSTSEVGAVNAGGVEESLEPRGVWRWLLLGALGVLMVEWWIYNRRAYL